MSHSTVLHKFIAIICGEIELALALNVLFDFFIINFIFCSDSLPTTIWFSLCLLPFVMPDKLKILLYIDLLLWMPEDLCALNTIIYQISIVFYSQTTEHIKLILDISLHAKGPDPNFFVKGLLASVLRAILFFAILWCSWLGFPLFHLFGCKAGQKTVFQIICRDVAAVLDLISVHKNDLGMFYLENELYRWS